MKHSAILALLLLASAQAQAEEYSVTGPANGKALLGIIVPGGADRIEKHDGHILAVKKIEPGSSLTYYWGFAWDKCDIRDMKQWSKYLENYLK